MIYELSYGYQDRQGSRNPTTTHQHEHPVVNGRLFVIQRDRLLWTQKALIGSGPDTNGALYSDRDDSISSLSLS